MIDPIYPNVEEMPDDVLTAVLVLAALLIKAGRADADMLARHQLCIAEQERRLREECGAVADWGICRLATGHPDIHVYT